MNKQIADYWMAYYISPEGVCALCGNTGKIDTRQTAISPKGVSVGRIDYCICPNGQKCRELKVDLYAGTLDAALEKFH